MFELATGALAGWEVLPSPGASGRQAGGSDGHMVAMALTALADLRAGQFVATRISARALTGDVIRGTLSGTPSLDGLALIVLGNISEESLLILERVRERGALVGCDAAGADGDLVRAGRFTPDLLSLAPSGAAGAGHDLASVSAMVRLARELGARTLMHGIDNGDDAARFSESGVGLGQGPAMGPPQRQAPAPGDPAGSTVPTGDRDVPAAAASSSPSPTSALQELAERAPCVDAWESLSAIVDLSLDDAEHDWLVIVDARGRPVGLVERAALLRGEPFERRVEVVGTGTPLRAAAQTALARPKVDRSRPLVLCDADDRYLGVLRIERLLEALAA